MVFVAKPLIAISAIALLLYVDAAYITRCVSSFCAFTLTDLNQRANPNSVRVALAKTLSGGTSSLSILFSPLLFISRYADLVAIVVIPNAALSFVFMFFVLLSVALRVFIVIFLIVVTANRLAVLSTISLFALAMGARFAICGKSISLLFIGLKVVEGRRIFIHAARAAFEETQLFHSVSLSLYHLCVLAGGVISRFSGINLANTQIIARKAA